MKIYCIADEDTVRGFRLAGIDGQAAKNAAEASDVLARVAEQVQNAIIILTESTADSIRKQVETIRVSRKQPLIVEIPGPGGALPGRKSLRRLVQEVVGIRISQRGVV